MNKKNIHNPENARPLYETLIPGQRAKKEFETLRGKRMCPLRFILVFLSAILAGYFAWRSMGSSSEVDLTMTMDLVQEKASHTSKDEVQERNVTKMVQDGFWVFVDMASGRYLWRNFKEMKKDEKAKNC